jgi:4-amino-4-deoxy-L-arabinose transferase-like glycosyltransferase
MKDRNRQFYALLFFLALIVNLSGIGVRFFTDDPGLYASLAKNLVYKHDFWQLYTYNQDWLDKPHFPFWMTYFSFKVFGIHDWAYRLPALFFFLLSGLYTYLFSRKYYGHEIAAMAVLILMTAQMALMSNVDVRAEPYLMGLIIGSLYHISRLDDRFNFGHLILAALLTACAIMTKGLFVVVAIYGGLFFHLLMQKRLLKLFSMKWIALVLLTAVFVLPEIYALYIQFDTHPEKVIFGTQHVSGIKWFLWDSQFGRFVNSGPITRKSGNPLFFVHTLLWAFAPWCLMFYFAICRTIREMYRKHKLVEYYTFGGGILLLLLFSLSSFQQPFYPNSIFPLFAVITAPYCYTQLDKFGAWFRLISQWVYIIALPALIIFINFEMLPGKQLFFAADCIVFGMVIFLIASEIKRSNKKVFMLNCAVALFVNFYLNTVFYPLITQYKGQFSAAEYINQPQNGKYHIYALRAENNIFQFYTKKPIDLLPLEQFQAFKPTDSAVFFVSQPAMDYLVQNHVPFKLLKSFVDYPQENILPKFVYYPSRYGTLRHVYLITK